MQQPIYGLCHNGKELGWAMTNWATDKETQANRETGGRGRGVVRQNSQTIRMHISLAYKDCMRKTIINFLISIKYKAKSARECSVRVCMCVCEWLLLVQTLK